MADAQPLSIADVWGAPAAMPAPAPVAAPDAAPTGEVGQAKLVVDNTVPYSPRIAGNPNADAGGTFTIKPNSQGAYTDSNGLTYTPDPKASGRFLDPQGRQYQIDTSAASPPPPPPQEPAPLSVADVWGPGAGGGDGKYAKVNGEPAVPVKFDHFGNGIDADGNILTLTNPPAAPVNPAKAAFDAAHPATIRTTTLGEKLNDTGAAAALRGVADTLSLGFANKADAATEAALDPYHLGGKFADRYSYALDNQQGQSATAEANHPADYRGGRIAAGVVAAPFVAPEGVVANAAVGGGLAGLNALGNARGPWQDELAQAANAVPMGVLTGAGGGSLIPKSAGGAPGFFGRAAEPFAAAVSPAAAEVQAGRQVANGATDLPAVRASLASGPDTIIPGSTPTTFQQTGDMGLGGLERGVATRSPGLFTQRAAEQNSARVGVLGDIQTGADPADTARFLKTQFDDMDAATEKAVQEAADKARTAGGVLGGAQPPEGVGAATRDALTQAAAASKAHYDALFKAVDADGTSTANVAATKQGVADVVKGMAPTEAPPAGAEAALYGRIAAMSDVSPLRDLIAVRPQLTDLATQARIAGDNVSAARINAVKSALDRNLASTISDKVQADQAAVAAGTMAPEDAAGAKVRDWVDNWQQQRTVARTGTGSGNPTDTRVGTASVPSLGGTERASGIGPGGPAGNPGLPSIPQQPTIDAAAAGRLKDANTAFATHAQTFGNGPVGSVLKDNGFRGDFTLPNGAVPQRFFHTGPRGFDDMTALLKASPEALPHMQDYAALDLRRAAGRADGSIDPAKFSAWQRQHADALRALPPETQARFADAAAASGAVDDALVSRAAALKQAQSGAIGKVMNLTDPSDVTRTVGGIFGGKTAAADMRKLAGAASVDPDARAGLRQAVADYISNKFVGNTEAATSGVGTIKADGFQTFVRQNRAALGAVFSPEEIANLDRIAADIQRSGRSATAVKLPGSNTAQDMNAAGAVGGHGHGGGGTLSQMLLSGLGAATGHILGEHLGMGEYGTMIGATAGPAIAGIRSAGIKNVNDLVTQAMLNPDVARRLLERVSPDAAKAAKQFAGLRAAILESGASRGDKRR